MLISVKLELNPCNLIFNHYSRSPMAKIKICKTKGCNNAATTAGYCRLHYLMNWRRLKETKQRDAAERLNKYIDKIVEKHPDKYVEIIKKELKSRRFEKNVTEEYGADQIDDVYQIFSDPGFEGDVETLIKNLRIEKKF